MATQTWKENIWQKVYETGPKKNLIYIQNSSTDYFCLKKWIISLCLQWLVLFILPKLESDNYTKA